VSGQVALSYYPGCSLEGSAAEFDASVRAVSDALGLELHDLPDWSCCGASAAHGVSPDVALGLAARNLAIAEKAGRDVVIPCASCFQRLKRAEDELLSEDGGKGAYRFSGIVKLWDLAALMAQETVLERLKATAKRPLSGLKCVCYYGCLTQRPPKVTGAEDPEDPQTMDRLLDALGAQVFPWSYKTDCCGASLALTRPDLVGGLVSRLVEHAAETGAQCIVTGCQMCQSNLDMRQPRSGNRLPILYFTELMGLAMGLPDVGSWLSRHIVDPLPLLRERGLL